MGIRKKYLLKTADFNLNHFKTQLKVFANLEDIKYLVNLDEIKIRVSESFGLSLSTINLTDPFFFKSVTPNMFLDLSLGRYSLKAGNRKNQNANDDLKIILSDEVKEELENSLMYQRPDLSRMNSCTSYINNKLRGIDPRLF
ncbi:hypothetical protein NQ317_000417 [Molorchus minor]|uniref:Uncharacterized protein n=1 Tax=Molorchus minor TaxID=1323400 RepID=A0ABQ9JWL9_9CUCU|nr:hypothetical protein NQ317_000417 [Molorchus minor]